MYVPGTEFAGEQGLEGPPVRGAERDRVQARVVQVQL